MEAVLLSAVLTQLLLVLVGCQIEDSNLTIPSRYRSLSEINDLDKTYENSPTIPSEKHLLPPGPLDGVPLSIERFPGVDPILPHSTGKGQYCRRPAKCHRLNYTTCMGMRLPYKFTTLELIPDSSNEDVVQEKLQMWQGLRHLPKCWSVIQPFLCALYMPKCEDGMVDLPSQEMCKVTVGPCRLLHMENIWPSFFKCDNTTRFPPMCKNDVRELKFNTTGQCQEPLIPTDNSKAFYEGVDGCGVQCQDPLFTSDEQQQIHKLIAWAGSSCLLLNIFTVATFLIDWRSANKYPALIIFYINCCFMVSCIGWLAQFTPGARKDIVCRKDGTLRMSEPSAGENLSCVIVFVLVYYFLMAAVVWFVILTYAWHLSFQALGKVKEKIDKKGAYFHLVAWSLPLILTITTMALGEIDGNIVTGICFVGYVNHSVRAGLLLAPLSAAVLVGGYFLSRGLITLILLKIGSHEIISTRASAKIRETIVRLGLFSLLIVVFTFLTFTCHVYEFQNHSKWKNSFRKYVVCRIVEGAVAYNIDPNKCKMEFKPSLAMMQLHILAVFTAGIVMSSWIWTDSTVLTWKRFLRRTLNSGYEEPVRLKKHKVIAQAFAKRKTLNNAGRLSLSFHSTHEDPVGLNFDMNSMASQDLSSTWAAALPKLMTRRGALIGVTTGSLSSQRRNSIDSEISYSVRKVSVESRRHSLDSQVSVQISEVTATRKTRATPMPAVNVTRCRGPRSRRRRRDFVRGKVGSKVGPLTSRKGSSSSQESQLGTQIINALTMGNADIAAMVPNLMKRREATVGLDGFQLSYRPTIFGPSTCGSEEEGEKAFDITEDVPRHNNETENNAHIKRESELPKSEIQIVDESKHQWYESNDSESRKLLENVNEKSHNIVKEKEISACTTIYNREGKNSKVLEDSKLSEISDDDDNFMEASYDDTTSYCPELMQLAGSMSDASAFTLHTLGGGKMRTVAVGPCSGSSDKTVYVKSREIGTQTCQPEDVEMQEMNSGYHTLRNHSSVSQGTQVNLEIQHNDSITKRLKDKIVCLPGFAVRGLRDSYDVNRFVEELAEAAINQPLRPNRRKK